MNIFEHLVVSSVLQDTSNTTHEAHHVAYASVSGAQEFCQSQKGAGWCSIKADWLPCITTGVQCHVCRMAYMTCSFELAFPPRVREEYTFGPFPIPLI